MNEEEGKKIEEVVEIGVEVKRMGCKKERTKRCWGIDEYGLNREIGYWRRGRELKNMSQSIGKSGRGG